MPKIGTLKQLAKTKKKKLDPVATADLIESNFDDEIGERIVILGPPKIGKTRLAATLSKRYPEVTPPPERIVLDDALWLSADARATDTLKGINIQVEQLPLWKMLGGDDTVQSVLETAIEVARAQVEAGKTLIVVDSVSKLDKTISYHYEEVAPPLTDSGKRNSFAIWRRTKADHLWFHQELSRLHADIIFIFHAKIAGDSAIKKLKADALPGGFSNVILDTDYQDAANIYRRDTSWVCSLQYEQDKRWLYTRPHKGFEGGNRFQDHIDTKEEPHLGKLFDKVNKALGITPKANKEEK